MAKKLYKSNSDIKLDGVCAGAAKYFGWDVTLVRIIVVIVSFCTGLWTGFVAYIVCALIMPREPESDFIDYRDVNQDRDDRQN